MKPYVIWSPPWNRKVGGVHVLHTLCHLLRKKGVEAYVTSPQTDPAYDTPFIPLDQLPYMPDFIAVYPEVARGNPFNAPYVVRYILNKPGLLGGDKTYDSSELLVAFTKILLQPGMPEDQVLFLPTTEPGLFRPPDEEKRKGSCYYIGKGTPDGSVDLTGMTQITSEYPAARKELAKLFQTSEVFYTYDYLTILYHEAAFCGCPAVILNNQQFTKEQLKEDELGLWGIAWGNWSEELEYARKTVHLAYDNYLSLLDSLDSRLDHFIEITQKIRSS